MKLYNEDSKLYEILGNVGDLIILNILFIISCLPIITIGASITSMHSVTNKMVMGENINIFKVYKDSFIKNFKQATLVWIFVFFAIMILILDIQILGIYQNNILLGLVIGVLILLIILISYIFPMIACFHNTIFIFIKNSFVIASLNILTTLIVFILNVLPILLLFVIDFLNQVGHLFYLLIGFSSTSYLIMKILSKVFKKYTN